MAMPCSSAAAITSSSRTLPPGWITARDARTPRTASRPSRNGKKASLAAAPALGPAGRLVRRRCGPSRPGSAGPRRSRRPAVLGREHDGVASSPRAHTCHASSRSRPLRRRRARARSTTVHVGRSSDTAIGLLHEQATVDRAHVERGARPGGGAASTRRFFLRRAPRARRRRRPGATTTSVNTGASASASAAGTGRLTATMPPNADTGSQSWAADVGGGDVVGDRDAARVGVLDDHDRRLRARTGGRDARPPRCRRG